MNFVRLTANGQITIPAEIRKLLGLKTGDKIVLYQNDTGDIVLNNASADALYKAQIAMEGVAEKLELKDEDDVQLLVNEVRYGDNKI